MTGMFLAYSRRTMTRFGDTARSMGDMRGAGEAALSTAGAKPERASREEE